GVVGRLAELLHVPAVGAEASGDIVAVGELGGTVDRDVVVVVDVDEAAEAQVAGEGGGLVADALFQVTVAADDERVVVADLAIEAGAEPALGDAHPDRAREALAERAGGDVDPRRVVHLGVPGRAAAPLPEGLEVVGGEPL